MTRIFLIRHAEAEGNLYRRAQGQSNGLITGRGNIQIERLRERLFNEKIDAVYSSDLSRTLATAEAASLTRGLTVNADKRLREVDMGEWEDASWGELQYKNPEMSRYFVHDPARWSVKGAEDYTDVQRRITECISEIGGRHDGETVAVFSHGFAIRSFLCGLMGVPSDKTGLIPFCGNTAVTALRFEDGVFVIEYNGDVSHLSGGGLAYSARSAREGPAERFMPGLELRYELSNDVRDRELIALCGAAEAYTDKRDWARFTAFSEDTHVGVAGISTDRAENDAARLEYIYVMPELRGKSCGVQLLGQAVSYCRRLRLERLRLPPRRDAAVDGFFCKFGFIEKSGGTAEKNVRNW